MGPSEPTSDERPDLGASFTTVIREIAYLMQPPLRDVVMRHNNNMRSFADDDGGATMQDDFTFTPSDLERGRDARPTGGNDSTVWDNMRIASYLASHTPSFTPSHTVPDGASSHASSSQLHAQSTPRTILQTALHTQRSSPIRESSFASDVPPSKPIPRQVYHHINDWEPSQDYLAAMPYVESRSQSRNPSSRNDMDADEDRAVEIHDTLSSIRSSSLPSFTPDPEVSILPPPPIGITRHSPTYTTSRSNSILPLSAFNNIGSSRLGIPLAFRSAPSDIVNDMSEDPHSSHTLSLGLQSQNIPTPSAPSTSSRPPTTSSSRDSSPRRDGILQDDYETVHIDSSIDSSVLSRTEDEDSGDDDGRDNTEDLRRLVLHGGLDLVREESTEGGVRHEVIRPLVMREDSSRSELILPLNYPRHSKHPSGNSGVSSSESTLSSKNNTLSGSHTISAPGTLHNPSPRRAYSPPTYRVAQDGEPSAGLYYRAYHDLNDIDRHYSNTSAMPSSHDGSDGSIPQDPTVSSFDPVALYDHDRTSGTDDNEPYVSRSEASDLNDDDDFNDMRDTYDYRVQTNVYAGGRTSSMARSLPNLGRVALDDDDYDEDSTRGYHHPSSDLSFTSEYTHESAPPHLQSSPGLNPSLGTLAEALTYLAQEREKISRGRVAGGDGGVTLPLNIKGKSKERLADDLDVQYESSSLEQDFQSGGKATSHGSGLEDAANRGGDTRDGWREILEFRHRRRRKRSESPHDNARLRSKPSRTSTSSTLATVLPADPSISHPEQSKGTASTGSRTPKSSATPKQKLKRSKTDSKADRQRLSLDIEAASPTSAVSSLGLSIRLPSFATALTPTGTLTSGGENVREFGIFGKKVRSDKAESAGSPKDKGKGKRKEKLSNTPRQDTKDEGDSATKKKSSRTSVPRILKRPAIPFPTTSAPARSDGSIPVDSDATPIIASAPFRLDFGTSGTGRKLSTHSRASTLRSAPVQPSYLNDPHASYVPSSDADESSGLGVDDANENGTSSLGVEDITDQSDKGSGSNHQDSHNWQQRLVNEHQLRLDHSKSRKSSRPGRGHVRGVSEQLVLKDHDILSQGDPALEPLDKDARGSHGESKLTRGRSFPKRDADGDRKQTVGPARTSQSASRSLLHARSSPFDRPDPNVSGSMSGGGSARNSMVLATSDLEQSAGGSSDADGWRLAQLRALGQKLRKAFPEDARFLDQLTVLSDKRVGKGRGGNKSSGQESTGRDSDKLPINGQADLRKKKRSRRRKAGAANGGEEADDGGDEDDEDELLWDGGFIDTRGRLPKATDPPIHVFIDQLSLSIALTHPSI
ncbi:hypothetical protein ONZ45_g8262 [Pleurotus djamor]|nr:hypothetical protein ONZ45_g8262 [Pleurotus djamor]